MNENILDQEAILINDSDEEVSLGNFHVEEDPIIEPTEPEEVEEEPTDLTPEFLEVNVHDAVMGTAVGPGQL
jgi:hypothetical protein